MTEILLPMLSGLFVAVVAAYLTAQLALRKFYSEKWWERKANTYVQIIEALYDLLQYCEIKRADYGDGAGYSEEKLKEFSERYNRAYWEVKKATDIGAFVVSSEAEIILKELRNRPELEWDKCPPWEIYAQDYQYYRDALAKIVEVAKRDLKARNRNQSGSTGPVLPAGALPKERLQYFVNSWSTTRLVPQEDKRGPQSDGLHSDASGLPTGRSAQGGTPAA